MATALWRAAGSRARAPEPEIGLLLVCGGGPLLLSWAAYRHSIAPPPPPASRRVVEADAPPLAGFFGKRLASGTGIDVRAHADVSDEALLEAGRVVRRVTAQLPRSVVGNMRSAGAEVRVLGKEQRTSDMPDLRHHRGKVWDKVSGKTLDERARGLGGISCVCAEENLLKLPSDRHADHRSICVHEFAHVVHRHGLDGRGKRRVTAAYERAKEAGLWPGCYAMTNEAEYFAELSMWYFGSHGDWGKLREDGEAEAAPGREWFARYDKHSYRLFDRLYSGQRRVEPDAHVRLLPVPTEVEEDSESGELRCPQLRARSGGRRCSVVFDNRTAQRYTLSWVDYKGGLRRMGEVHPAEKKGMQTYAGHSFVLTRKLEGRAEFVAAFSARREHGRAVLQPEPRSPPTLAYTL